VSAEFDEHARSYDEQIERAISFSRREHDFFTKAKVDALLSLVARRLGDPGKLRALDVGCGSGVAHRFLTPRLGALEAADVSPEMLAIAKRANPDVTYHLANGSRLPLPTAEYDLAAATCVIHHVLPPERPPFLSEMARVVRPGGLVVVFEHNPLNPLTRLVVRRVDFDADAELTRMGRLQEHFRASGIPPLESRFIVLFPWRGAVFTTVEQLLRRVPLGAQYYVCGRRSEATVTADAP
jgi:ubiquinone/menaquinone biosynthesis C-methylase UbiE